MKDITLELIKNILAVAGGFGEADAGRLADETHPHAPADVDLVQPAPRHPAARGTEKMVHSGSRAVPGV